MLLSPVVFVSCGDSPDIDTPAAPVVETPASGEIRQAGRAVIAEAVAPDVDVSDLFLTD